MSVDNLLEDIGKILDEGKAVPFSNKVIIDAEEIRSIIEDISLSMPEEFTKARKIASERRDILNEAQTMADDIISKAEQKAKGMVEEHEITKGAKESANEIMQQARVQASELIETTRREANDMMEQAHKWSTDMRDGALQFVEEIINSSDEALTDSVNEIRRTRQQIRVAASKKQEPRPNLGENG